MTFLWKLFDIIITFSIHSAVAETTTGCLFAVEADNKYSYPCEATGVEVAIELMNAVSSGGCVDKHLQDQVSVLTQ